MRDVEVFPDPEHVAGAVASRFLDRIVAAQARGEIPQVLLTGGTVARLVHREIAELATGGPVDWTRIVFWFGDERFVPADSADRNCGQARADLLDRVGATRVHEVAASDQGGTLEEAARSYAALIAAQAPDGFDLVMLGMGPDGHVASLFPGHPELTAPGTAVAVHDSPKPPPERVSLTFAALNHARAVWFLVTGAEKAAATQRAWAFDGSVAETPARGITGPSVTWFVDQAASGQ